jgi:hypothetical protein
MELLEHVCAGGLGPKLQTSARYRYNPKAYRLRARPAGFWHVNDLIAKLHATPTLRKKRNGHLP